jgi:prepilin-type processing-associated H-X9-DG protein/prepilin-type N-terminal cleavage/methylation domain-containing protein
MTGGGYRSPRRAFSLVELLVVIGVIALLIAILLPALGRARENANRVHCADTLRQLASAANLHALDHQGYLPTAGWHWNCVGGITDPRGLDDPSERRYEYYDEDGTKRPAPVTVALAKYLGVTCRTDSRMSLEEDMKSQALRKLFRCGSQQSEYSGLTQIGDEEGSWRGPEEFSSYAFNEALLGRRRASTQQCPRGKLSRVVESSKVMFALDGRPRDQTGNRYLLVPDSENLETISGETLYDFQQQVLGPGPAQGQELLDFARHGMRVNVLFVDGHVDTIPMGLPPEGGAGLKQVYVSKGISW